MNNVIKFKAFLENIKQFDPFLIESIQKAFNILLESTEEIVKDVKAKMQPEEETEDIWKKLIGEEGEDEVTEELPLEAEIPEEEPSPETPKL
jgi:hypothetical protein